MKICNAFERKTRKGASVFRIKLDIPDILSQLEQGNTLVAIDILTTKTGLPVIQNGSGKFGPYRALHYYSWAKRPDDKPVQQGATV